MDAELGLLYSRQQEAALIASNARIAYLEATLRAVGQSDGGYAPHSQQVCSLCYVSSTKD